VSADLEAARTAPCTCLDQMNEHLRPYGGAVLTSLLSEPPRVFVATTHLESVKRKKKLPLVVATFCPFCGVKVPEDTGPLAKLKESS
jgi:hypothetical protein